MIFDPCAITALTKKIFKEKKSHCGLQTIKVALGKGFRQQTATFCRWIPFPMATFAVGKLFQRQKVAISQGFH